MEKKERYIAAAQKAQSKKGGALHPKAWKRLKKMLRSKTRGKGSMT